VKTKLKNLIKYLFLISVLWSINGCEQSLTNEQDNTLIKHSRAVSIEVARIERRDMKRTVNVYGIVIPSPPSKNTPNGGQAILTSPNSGLVKEVYFSEGQKVKRGEVIAVLDDTIAKAQVKSANAGLVYAEKTINQDKKLFARHNNSQQQINLDKQLLAQAKANLIVAENVLSNLYIKSPIDGIVSKINVSPGLSIDLNRIVAKIINPNRLEIEVELPSQYSAQISVGQTVQLRSRNLDVENDDANTKNTHSTEIAVISSKSPTINVINGTQLLRLEIKNIQNTLVGQLLPLRIIVEEHTQVFAVPRTSIYVSPRGDATLSTIKDSRSNSQKVVLGLQDNGYIEIIGNDFYEGQLVATKGSYLLPDNSDVEYSPAKLTGK